MKVLIVSPDEKSGGVAAVVRNLTHYLLDLDYDVQMFYPGRSIFIRSSGGNVVPSALSLRLQLPLGERHPLVNLTLFWIRFPVALVQLLWLIQAARIQVFNIHHPTDCLFYFALCRRMLRFMLVCSIYAADVFRDYERLHNINLTSVLLESSSGIHSCLSFGTMQHSISA